ncbi:MAG: hypothetical protein ABS35_37665 [Kaistia sp. SCN 65-12]|jgi:hypothetical protein|nr:MAG: hypothetical protein ABS35_37665 [Kaistia sp. SCN 65-12]
MLDDKQEKVRKRAYEIWDAEGRVEGHPEDHWRRAELEVEAEEARGGGGTATDDLPPKRRPKVDSRPRART